MKKFKTIFKNFINDRALMIRVTVLFYALINQFLVAAGYSPLPFAEAEVEEFISMLLTMLATVWVGYRNSNLTDEAVQSQSYLDDMKNAKKHQE